MVFGPVRVSHDVARNTLLILCILIVLASLGLRVLTAAHTNAITHDDAISYLAATGHESDYYENKNNLAGHWLRASRLKAYTSIDERFDFNRIKNDLVYHDVHPPLYFWLLHLWLIVIGVSAVAGPFLNCLIFPGTVFIVYQLVYRGTRDRVTAAIACALLAASPMALNITTAARQYELLMFFSAAIMSFGLAFVEKTRPRPIDYFLLFLMALAGVLTHYYFVFPIASVFLLTAYHERKLTRKLVGMLASLLSAMLAFVLLMPRFYIQFYDQHARKAPFEWQFIPERLERIAGATANFFGWHPGWSLWFASIAMLAGFGTYLMYLFKARAGETAVFEKTIWYFVFFNAGIIFFLYVIEATSEHAMGPRYLALVTPAFAIVVALIVNRLQARRRWLATALMIGFSVNAFIVFDQGDTRKPANVHVIEMASRIVFDNPARGVIFRDLINVRPKTWVYVAWRRNLIKHEARWNRWLGKGDLIVLDDGYANAFMPRVLLEWQVKSRHRIKKVNPDEWRILSSITAR